MIGVTAKQISQIVGVFFTRTCTVAYSTHCSVPRPLFAARFQNVRQNSLITTNPSTPRAGGYVLKATIYRLYSLGRRSKKHVVHFETQSIACAIDKCPPADHSPFHRPSSLIGLVNFKLFFQVRRVGVGVGDEGGGCLRQERAM